MKLYEFWHPKIFEFPWYAYIGIQCALKRLKLYDLVKANYGLDHGGAGFASKWSIQQLFDQSFFPATLLIKSKDDYKIKLKQANAFARTQKYPLIVKPDSGACGKAVIKVHSGSELKKVFKHQKVDLVVQKFVDLPFECGIFYVRTQGRPRIFSMNQKHYPAVVGDGIQTLRELAQMKHNYSKHWSAFLRYHDMNRILKKGELYQLSFIGSHTLGCIFTDDTLKVTKKLENAVFAFLAPVGGFNYGRLDVKAGSMRDLQQGKFTVIEVNGVDSISTNIFDPSWSIAQTYQTLFAQGKLLVEIAKEHSNKPMNRLPPLTFVRACIQNNKDINDMHAMLLDGTL